MLFAAVHSLRTTKFRHTAAATVMHSGREGGSRQAQASQSGKHAHLARVNRDGIYSKASLIKWNDDAWRM